MSTDQQFDSVNIHSLRQDIKEKLNNKKPLPPHHALIQMENKMSPRNMKAWVAAVDLIVKLAIEEYSWTKYSEAAKYLRPRLMPVESEEK